MLIKKSDVFTMLLKFGHAYNKERILGHTLLEQIIQNGANIFSMADFDWRLIGG